MDVKSILRSAGLRHTAQRARVLEALDGRESSVTALELHYELRLRKDPPGLATIYRTLQSLAGAGVLDTFQRDGEQAFRRCGTDHHHHLVCTSCGLVQEVDGAEVEVWVSRMARRKKFRVTSHTADIYGRCLGCSN